MLIAFPIAFGVRAPVFDVVGLVAERSTVWITRAYLATYFGHSWACDYLDRTGDIFGGR
jgi:hypothetical protein